MVSISIMVGLSTALLWNYPDSSVRIKLANLTQTVALLVREAQIKGSAVASNNGQYAGYGLYFNLTSYASSSEIILFGDEVIANNYINGILVGDGLYNGTTTNNEIKTITTLPNGFTISKLCVASKGTFYCNASTTPQIDTLSISFIRPNPQPLIYVNDSVDTILSYGSTTISAPYTGACIEVSSRHAPNPGHIRSIRVEGAGFITTKVSGCE